MIRHFYISDDLDDLDRLEQELEKSGIYKPQIHVMSRDDAGVDTHPHLHNIEAVLKLDVVHGVIVGAVMGTLLAAMVLLIGNYSSVSETYTWMPIIFLAVVLLGFSTWWGGFHGIHKPHKDFERFEKDLEEGKHVFIVDADLEQENLLKNALRSHMGLKPAGTGSATPRWIVMGQQLFKDVTSHTFP